MNSLQKPVATALLCVLSVVTSLTFGVRGAHGAEVPDPSVMVTLLPAAAQAPAPPCIKPGTRLTYYGMSASIRGERGKLVPDEHGEWVDERTGKRYTEKQIFSGSGAGYNVVSVGAVDGSVVQLSTKLYTLDSTMSQHLFSLSGGVVGHAGCAADYWIHPDVLRQVQEINTQGVRIVRMPYNLGGRQYNAIRFQTEDISGCRVQMYDLETGLLIYHASRIEQMVNTLTHNRTMETTLGSTQLASGWIVEVKDVDIPWKDAAAPAWIGQFAQLSYSGAQTTIMPTVGSRLDRPMMTTFTPKARGANWVRFAAHSVIQSIQGLPPEQVQQEWACGSATIGGLWIAPAALAQLRPQQPIERNDIVGTTTVVSNVGPGGVTITETGPLHRLDYTYNTQTGMLSTMTITQRVGMANMIHNVQFTGQR